MIAVIRESDEPKPELMRRFSLSERQAEDILEIKLRQLSRLSEAQIKSELESCRDEEKSLTRLLSSDRRLATAVAREIESDAKTYGDDRRTLVEEAAPLQAAPQVLDEPVTIVFSEKGFIRTRSGHGHDISLMNYKIGDGPGRSIECRSTETLILISSSGRSYSIAVSALPGSRGNRDCRYLLRSGRSEDVPRGNEGLRLYFEARRYAGACPERQILCPSR